MSNDTHLDRAVDAPTVRVRARALASPRRPVWLDELLDEARLGADEGSDCRDDVLAALSFMYDNGEIHAVVKDALTEWVPAPTDTSEFVSHVDRAFQALGRDPVRGELLVLLATASAVARATATATAEAIPRTG